jgi:isoleucyl-tRNA synthetase
VRLEPGEYELVLRPRNAVEGRTLPGDVGVVTLDTRVDDQLESEGVARDVVRLVQAERRDAGLHVSDCIDLRIIAPAETARAVETHKSHVAEQTLAVDVQITVGPELSVHVTKTPCPSSPNP